MKSSIKSGVSSGPKRPAPSGGSKSPSPVGGGSKGPAPSRPSRVISSPVPSSRPAPSSQPVPRPKAPVQKSQAPIYSTPQPRSSAPVYTQVPMPSRMPTSAYSEAAQRLSSARGYWEQLVGLAALPNVLNAIENVGSAVAGLDGAIAQLRSRGYRFGRGLEEKAATIHSSWPQQRAAAAGLVQSQRTALQSASVDVETLLRRATSDPSLISLVESRISDFEGTVRNADSQARGLFDQTELQINALRSEVLEADRMLDALDGASFDLLPDEHGVAACPAIWVSDTDAPEGMLFLTDARLIFEQRQEIVTKKFLFFATKTELVQNKLWESPIGAVEESQAEDQAAFLSRKEMLTLRFAIRTREIPSDVTLELRGGDNEEWVSLIRRVKSGQIESDRFGTAAPAAQLAAEVQAEAAAPEKELPTQCPNCNAPLPQVYKGMKQVACEYCGTVVNI